jgi:hypothetical protein
MVGVTKGRFRRWRLPRRSQSRTGSIGLATAGVLGWLSLLAVGTLGLNVSLAAQASFEIVTDKDAPGHDYKRVKDITLEDCEARCRKETQCAAFTYNHRRRTCFMKDQEAPALVDYRGATTGLKQELREANQSRGQPKPSGPSPTKNGVAARPLNPPDQPAILTEPRADISRTTKICSLFDSAFALTRNPDITLKFDQVETTALGDDKARMIFYKEGAKLLAGKLEVKDDRFRFVEDTDAPVARNVMILDSINPSGNSIRDPVFVVVSGLPFSGGVFRRVGCEAP